MNYRKLTTRIFIFNPIGNLYKSHKKAVLRFTGLPFGYSVFQFGCCPKFHGSCLCEIVSLGDLGVSADVLVNGDNRVVRSRVGSDGCDFAKEGVVGAGYNLS